MKSIPIFFFKEEIKFRLSEQDKLRRWILNLIKKEGYILSNLNFIYCDDPFLRSANREYLNHDSYTDILTFDNSDSTKLIHGDIYISIDRIQANAITYDTTFREELHRVMLHGILHLMGYGDKNKTLRAEMKKKEDYWLLKRSF